jgi:hypothetical protein
MHEPMHVDISVTMLRYLRSCGEPHGVILVPVVDIDLLNAQAAIDI